MSIESLESRLFFSAHPLISKWHRIIDPPHIDVARGPQQKPKPAPAPSPSPTPTPVTINQRPIIDPSLHWELSTGPLFSNGPTISDEKQGQVGDCYLISELGSLGQEYGQAAIQNLFHENSDGTITFYFKWSGGTDTVVVDRYLPVDSNHNLYYEGYGQSISTAESWLPFVEKAYAEWNYTTHEGQDGSGSYAGISGGWMANPAQQLGFTATTYYGLSTAGYQASLVTAVTGGKAVTIATNSSPGNGLYGNHAYSVSGYDPASGTFQLYNPWGFAQPWPLTYAQLTASCTGFAVA